MKNFVFRILFFIICILSFTFICNASIRESIGVDSLAARIMYQVWSFPQEKVYISTDRHAYLSGDTIRFRAFLVDASSHSILTNSSKFIYVELLNPFGDRVKVIKIRETDGIFAGVIPLEQEMPEGGYTLCAYTLFMQNTDSNYFFRKRIPIYSQLSSKYCLKTEIDSEYLTMQFIDKRSNLPVRVGNISITNRDGNFYTHKVRNRSSYTIHITKEMVNAGHIKVKFDNYEKYVTIPRDTAEMSLTFHPEGGYLIPSIKNRLAFKALDKKGLSKDFKGIIIDEKGDTIDFIKPTHKGMGMVMFVPEKDKSYWVKVGNSSYPLPSSNSYACVLNIDRINPDSILVKVVGKFYSGLSILAINRGNVLFARSIKDDKVIVERDKLGSGIVQFLLVDSSGSILSSRLFFNRRGYIFEEKDSIESIPKGDYTVRAFRGKYFIANSSSIVSDLFLQSELNGYIEDPDYYFMNNDSIADKNLDLLMLTHGWERYDISSSLKGKYIEPLVPMEIGGEISGSVRSRWRAKPLADALVMLISPQLDYASQTVTDDNGQFIFNGIDWPEDTSFIIQVFSKSGDKEHNYTVDGDIFPIIKPIETSLNELITDDSSDELLLTAGTILLDDLVVSAPLSAEKSRREMLAALGVKSFTSEELENLHITTYEEVLRKIPGLRVVNGNVVSSFAKGTYNTGQSGSNVEFWVDGVKWTATSSSSGSLAKSNSPILINAPYAPEHTYREHMDNTLAEFAAIYPFHIVESIEYFRPSAAMIISREATMGGGALVINTKDGSKIKEWDHDLFVKVLKPLGYQNISESYKPHYIYDVTSDNETLNAAWIPKVTSEELLPKQDDIFIEIEGFADGNIPALIKRINRDVAK